MKSGTGKGALIRFFDWGNVAIILSILFWVAGGILGFYGRVVGLDSMMGLTVGMTVFLMSFNSGVFGF